MRLPRGYLEAGRKRTRGQEGTVASGHLGNKLPGRKPRQLMGRQGRKALKGVGRSATRQSWPSSVSTGSVAM